MNDPKLLRLSDASFRAWTILLCIASKHDGKLPPAADIALMLRTKTTTVATWITELSAGGLLDNVDGIYAPHNWEGRQYKSDSSNERVKRHRQQKRNVTRNVTDTVTVTAPEQKQNTEQSRADARPAFESEFLKTLAEVFGKPETELTRARVWLGKGYSSTMILETIQDVLARGTEIGNLSYFDAILAERHANRPETPSERAAVSVDMDEVAAFFKKTGKWSKYAGPEPGMIGCKCPPDILAKHGIVVPGMRRMDA